MTNEKAPERIRILKREGRFDGHWYLTDAAVSPYDAEFEYVRVDLFTQLERERDAQRQEIENAERYQAKLLAPTTSTRRAILAALTFLLVLAAYAIMIRLIG